VILSHHMLYGLKAGQSKMSKSDPDSAIFMEDTREDVERKIKNAYCPREVDAAVVKATADDEMSLVKDDLKNPCLDYLKFILFSNDNFVFKVGNKSYTTYEDARAAFLSGAISEDVLKDCLIVELNNLLDPVRAHFKNDPRAKELLSKITGWKKENLAVTVSVNKLKIIDPKKGPVFAVFAPMASEVLHFEAVLSVLQRLQSCPKGSQAVLWLEDWSAYALGKMGCSPVCIKAFYDLLLHGLSSLAPELMKQVRVCWQQETILSGASEYWISVINAGRGSNLGDVTRSLPPGETLEFAGQVLCSLMHAGDVMALCEEGLDVVLCCDKYHENLHTFAAGYCKSRGLVSPSVKRVDAPRLRLLAEEEGGVEADVNIMLTDKELDVNRKLKKAFCQPQNVALCPPISWVGALLDFSIIKEFVITRKPDNGGDKQYTQVQALWDDFESGALHPGDLKPAVAKMLNAALECTRPGLKDNDALKKAQKELDAYTKSLAKKK